MCILFVVQKKLVIATVTNNICDDGDWWSAMVDALWMRDARLARFRIHPKKEDACEGDGGSGRD